MSSNEFLVIIKPDGVKRGLIGMIISRFEKKGYSIKQSKILTPSVNLASKHYDKYKNKSFFNDLIEFTCSGPVVAMILEGNISHVRNIVGYGVLKPGYIGCLTGSEGSIRDQYACSPIKNLVHFSEPVDAQKEIDLWFN